MDTTQRLGALVFATLVACPAEAPSQTVRVPAPVQAVDPTRQPVQAKVPGPLERSTRALAGLKVRPTDLELGRAVTYSVSRWHDRAGELRASGVTILKDRDGHWIIQVPDSGGVVSVAFATQRGKRYLVDFALDSPNQRFHVTSEVVNPERRMPTYVPLGLQTPIDGHLVFHVSGNGERYRVDIQNIVERRRFAVHYVKVIPLTN